jgi:uncharacterized damage-inducible protein DinB
MMKPAVLMAISNAEEFFERSTRVLAEADSGFRPAEGMFTAAQQVAHTAQTIDWFVEGAGRPEGFDLDFEKHMAGLASATSLTEARNALGRAFASARKFFEGLTEEQLTAPLPAGPVMGGAPVSAIAAAIQEHTAHHRGALTVYSRLLGKTPVMPYGE